MALKTKHDEDCHFLATFDNVRADNGLSGGDCDCGFDALQKLRKSFAEMSLEAREHMRKAAQIALGNPEHMESFVADITENSVRLRDTLLAMRRPRRCPSCVAAAIPPESCLACARLRK